MAKCPYRFPARSRAAMISAIEQISHRRFYDGVAWPFTWNAKLDFYPMRTTAADLNPQHYDGGQFDPSLDDQWSDYLEGNESVFWRIAEGVARPYLEGDYSTYPGDDSGAFKFSFRGRCGGWLVLESAFGIDLRGLNPDDLSYSDEWAFADVRRLYRALVCMDSDFSREKVREEFQFQQAFRRCEWEAGIRQEREAARQVIREGCDKIRALHRGRKELAPALATFESWPVAAEAMGTRIRELAREVRAAVHTIHPELAGESN